MSDEPRRPSDDNREAWRAHWSALGMPWRTEPEIGSDRQAYLAERRVVEADIERGIYPFRDEQGRIRLTRADVEWLLATHESGGMRGPVDWSDEKQRGREGLDLRGADLSVVDLSRLPLARVRGGPTREEWLQVSFEKSQMAAVNLEHADLNHAQLQGVTLRLAQLQYASLWAAQLQYAYLRDARLQGAYLYGAQLQGASMRQARMDETTTLTNIRIDAQTRLADIVWHDASVTRVSWEQAPVLGDESEAHMREDETGKLKDASTRLQEFQGAVRANRQLAVVLRAQGLNEDADRYAYRAQVCQRVVLRRQGKFGRALGSWLLDAVAGYGYKPMRSVGTYVAVIFLFAAAYFAITNFGITPFLPTHPSTLQWYEALVLSISSFHGRGLFPSGLSLGDPLAMLAAGEAIIGLLIEITFIATFTQRFFAR